MNYFRIISLSQEPSEPKGRIDRSLRLIIEHDAGEMISNDWWSVETGVWVGGADRWMEDVEWITRSFLSWIKFCQTERTFYSLHVFCASSSHALCGLVDVSVTGFLTCSVTILKSAVFKSVKFRLGYIYLEDEPCGFLFSFTNCFLPLRCDGNDAAYKIS